MSSQTDVPLKVTVVGYFRLTRPLVGGLVTLITASLMVLATQGQVSWHHCLPGLLAVFTTCCACGSFNAYLDRDMDALLPRKSSRPVAAGIVKPSEALLCGFVLFIIAALSAWVFSIAFFGITLLAVFCSVVYTVLKRKMALSIFISALVVGLLPIGVWITLQGQVGLTGLVAAALLIFWFLSHLTAACFAHADEYKLIERPTVLCVYGEKVASALLVAAICGILLTSLALFRLGGLGLLYLATVLVGGSLLLASGVKVASTRSLKDGLLAFRLSRVYALALFLAMMIDILW